MAMSARLELKLRASLLPGAPMSNPVMHTDSAPAADGGEPWRVERHELLRIQKHKARAVSSNAGQNKTS